MYPDIYENPSEAFRQIDGCSNFPELVMVFNQLKNYMGPQAEKMITVARQGSLADRRRLIAKLNVDTANRLVDVIAPSLKRDSGYLRATRLDQRRVGDNAELATIEFVDEITEVAKPDKPTRKKPAKSAQSADNSKKEDK